MPTTTRVAARKAEAAGSASTSSPQRSNEQDLCNRQLWTEMAATMESATPADDEDDHRSVSSGLSEPRPTGGLMLAIRPLFLWFLLCLLLLASFFALASWVPATLQSACPSLCSTTVDSPAPLLAVFQGLGNRLDLFELGATKQAHTFDEFGDRLAGLQARSEEHQAQLDQVEHLRNLLGSLDSQVNTRLADLAAAAAKPKARQINWLSFDLGARAVPELSSPTAYFQPITATEMGLLNYGPNAALQPWLEHEPRYCTEGTSLQLAARLTRPIVPRELVMEYYSRAEVPAVGAAPREVELWIALPDPYTRELVVRMMISLHPNIFDTTQDPGRNALLDSHWVPIGRWTYDVLADEASQSMHVPVELDSLGIKINQVLIRANSNWGNKVATCLVRARLFGVDKSGLVEKF